MAETVTGVYDILYQSPIPLRELSSIAVAIELWHLDVNQYLKIGDFGEELYDFSEPEPRFTLRKVIPDVPPVIHQITEKYSQNLVSSIYAWLANHYCWIFHYHRDNHNAILKDFDDIVCDYDGTIHYVRTAKRMLFCDRISQDEKFKIACAYSFEDDIRQIAPSVLSRVNLDEIEYYKCAPLYYWVCKLRNELEKIPNEDALPIGDLMLKDTPQESRSSLEYFWNLASLECRYKVAVDHCGRPFCARFLLPKLNEEQFAAFINERGWYMLDFLLMEIETRELALVIWKYIKDMMSETDFAYLIGKQLKNEARSYAVDDSLVERSKFDITYHSNKEFPTFWQIWTSARDELKHFTIKQLLSKEWELHKYDYDINRPSEISLLLTILQDATLDDRSAFWKQSWGNLLCSTLGKDLHRMMKLCFASEDEINLFKKNTMSKYENLAKIVRQILKRGYFKELSKVLDFVCPGDEQSRRDLKRQCLQANFLDEHSILCINIICKSQSMFEFIDDAYADSARDFRDQFLAKPANRGRLLFCIQNGDFYRVKEFVDSFTLLGHNVESLKKQFADKLREYLTKGSIWNINAQDLRDFVFWCLGNDDRVAEFKQSISPGEILHYILDEYLERDLVPEDGLMAYPHRFDNFLLWYFDTVEEINEFRIRFADIVKMFAPPTR